MFAPSHAANAVIAFVQGDKASVNPGNQIIKAFPSDNTAGNLIVVSSGWNSAVATASISDSEGNLFATAVGPITNGIRNQIWYAKNIKGGANTVTITFSASIQGDMEIHEYAGIDAVNALDATSSNFGTAAIASSGAASTHQPNELIFGYADIGGGSLSAGAGFNQRFTALGDRSEDKVVYAKGAYSAVFDYSGASNWIVTMATFKGTGGGSQVSTRSDTLLDSRPSTTSNHAIAFQINNSLTTTSTNATSSLSVAFPPDFNLANIFCKDVDISFAGTATSIAGNYPNRATDKNCPGTATTWGLLISTSTNAITFFTPTSAGTYVATGTQVLIKIGTSATFQDTGTAQIVNPSTPGTYTISVGGTFGGSGNILVSINAGFEVAATVAESLSFTVSGVSQITPPQFVSKTELSRWNYEDSVPTTTIPFNIQAGDVLVAYAMMENAQSCPVSISNSDAALNWSRKVDQPNLNDANYSYLRMWTTIGDSSRSLTVTFSRACSLQLGGGVMVFRNSDGVGSATSTNNGANSGAPALSVTTTKANSAIVVMNADWNASCGDASCGGSRSWRTNAGDLLQETYSRIASRYAVYGGYYANAGAKGTYAVGLTAPSTQRYVIGAIEVLGSSSGGSCPADDGATVSQIDTTGTSVPFGLVTPNTFYQGCQDLTVSTNAPGGYSLSVQESYAMRTASGGYTIPDTTCDNGDCSVVTATTWVTPTKNGFGHTCANVSGSDCNACYLNGTKFKPVPNISAGTGPGMIQFVQGTTSINGSGKSSVNKAFTSANAAGDLLVVAVGWDAGSGIGTTAAISDSQGNLYATAVGPTVFHETNDRYAQVFYAPNCKGGANTVTVKLSGGSSLSFLDLYLHEYKGADTTAPLDRFASSTGSGVTLNSGYTAPISYPNELLFGFGIESNISAPGTNYTFRETADGNATEDRLVQTNGQYNATFTGTGGTWIAQIATFKAAPVETYSLMSSSTPAIATGRVKYRLSVPQSQAAGTYTTLITYTILGTF